MTTSTFDGSPMLTRILADSRDDSRLDAIRQASGLPPVGRPTDHRDRLWSARVLADAIGTCLRADSTYLRTTSVGVLVLYRDRAGRTGYVRALVPCLPTEAALTAVAARAVAACPPHVRRAEVALA